ncbi:MAG: hypothetical protein FJY21_11695 [Bacteroidetes bacterium]|nr:hypothetical protein [Bacteroidota bacterium]
MKPEKLNGLKKELLGRPVHELTDICLRLAKYKKENKELLSYLLFDAEDPMHYGEQIKLLLIEDFKAMPKHYYYGTKSMRKIIRLINRYAKYSGSKVVKTELSFWFCTNFLKFADLKTGHKPMQGLLTRQLEKIIKLIPKLQEDLQFDYNLEFENLMNEVSEKAAWVNKSHYL